MQAAASLLLPQGASCACAEAVTSMKGTTLEPPCCNQGVVADVLVT